VVAAGRVKLNQTVKMGLEVGGGKYKSGVGVRGYPFCAREGEAGRVVVAAGGVKLNQPVKGKMIMGRRGVAWEGRTKSDG
jgi:hypothetical protein